LCGEERTEEEERVRKVLKIKGAIKDQGKRAAVEGRRMQASLLYLKEYPTRGDGSGRVAEMRGGEVQKARSCGCWALATRSKWWREKRGVEREGGRKTARGVGLQPPREGANKGYREKKKDAKFL